MAIPCGLCGNPVHEHAVICPHCGGDTGVAVDPTLTFDERTAAIELDQAKADAKAIRHSYLTPSSRHYVPYDPELALIGAAAIAVGEVVKSAVEAVVGEHADEPELPRAYARERTAPHVVPVPSHEPEPAPPPAETPRFLK